MVKYIVLKTDGTFVEGECKASETYDQTIVALGGALSIFPRRRVPGSPKLTAYARDDGAIAQLPSNPWVAALMALGVRGTFAYVYFGNVVLFGGTSSAGNDMSVPKYVLEFVREVKRLDDEDESCDAMEELVEYVRKHQAMPRGNEEPEHKRRKIAV